MELEKRTVRTEISKSDEGLKIEGYALKFGTWSEVLGGKRGFVETIEKRALDEADMSNVVALVNHDENKILGRVGKNLELEIDDTGLRFKLKPTDTTYARDLLANMEEGIVNKCSFSFALDGENADEWEKGEGGIMQRTIKKIGKLYDVSVVTSPAYEDTLAVVSKRSLKKAVEDEERERIMLEASIYL